jgi:hypothetical protein
LKMPSLKDDGESNHPSFPGPETLAGGIDKAFGLDSDEPPTMKGPPAVRIDTQFSMPGGPLSKPMTVQFDLEARSSIALPMYYQLTHTRDAQNKRFFEIAAPPAHGETGKLRKFAIIWDKSRGAYVPGSRNVEVPCDVPFKSILLAISPESTETVLQVTVNKREDYKPPGRMSKWFGRHWAPLTFGALVTTGTYAVTNVLVPEAQQTIDASGLPSFLKSYLLPFIVPAIQIAISVWALVDGRVRKKEMKGEMI